MLYCRSSHFTLQDGYMYLFAHLHTLCALFSLLVQSWNEKITYTPVTFII
uniref:Uncharacterized protein n=1 Tax=Arundo donax TaxID=35708 RepID=A0A0A9H8T3_ARUDO